MGRSFNAEVIARLQSSFDTDKSLPVPVQQAIEHEMEERGGTAEEALIRLALTAMAQGGTLLYVTLTPGTKYQQFKDLLKAGETIIPPDASLVMERKPVKTQDAKKIKRP